MPVKGWIDVGEKHCQGCPFCLIMMEDASRVDGSELTARRQVQARGPGARLQHVDKPSSYRDVSLS